MTNFEIGVLIFLMTVFLLMSIAPMVFNVWFFKQETKKRKKEIESKNSEQAYCLQRPCKRPCFLAWRFAYRQRFKYTHMNEEEKKKIQEELK